MIHLCDGLLFQMMAMQLIQMDREVGVAEVDVPNAQLVELNDQTQIGGTTWERMRPLARKEGYHYSYWFVSKEDWLT